MARRADTLAGPLRRSSLNVGASSSLRRTYGQEHRYSAAILTVFSVKTNEVMFLELNRHENVRSGGDGKDQMRRCHQRGRPEDQQPTHIERVADVAIWSGSAKTNFGVSATEQMQPDLAQAE